MGGLSPLHWLIIGTVVAVPWLVVRMFRRQTWIERTIANWADRHYSAERQLAEPPHTGLLQFPVASMIWLIIPLACLVSAWSGSLSVTIAPNQKPVLWLSVVLGLLGQPLALVALAIHWMGRLGALRRLKYSLLITAFVAIFESSVIEQIVASRVEGVTAPVVAGDQFSLPISWQATLWLFAIPFTVAALSMLTRRVMQTLLSGSSGAVRAARWNTVVAPAGTWLMLLTMFPAHYLLLLVPGLGEAVIYLHLYLLLQFWLVRYELRYSLAQHPIVYLRAFRTDQGAKAFSQIVVPVSSRFGVIAGLTRSRQVTGELEKEVSTVSKGEFQSVSDDVWRVWVESALQKASWVIVDLSFVTENLEWEIEQAHRIVGLERTILIALEGYRRPLDGKLDVIEYSLSKPGIKATRRALRSWFVSKLDNASLASSTSVAAIATTK